MMNRGMIQPLFKGIKLAPFIECPHCHALSKPGTPECKFCNTKLSSIEDLNGVIVAENLGARYTPFVECPNCQKLVKVGIRRCRVCYEEIPEGYAFSSAATMVFNTVACDVANSIAVFDTFAALAVPLGIACYFLDLYSFGSPRLFYLTLFWPVMPLLTAILWFYRFGTFPLGDDEYLSAKRRVRRTLTLWLAFTSAQLIALGIWWL
jgi:hypothetical protein